jgi:hypothetical protein
MSRNMSTVFSVCSAILIALATAGAQPVTAGSRAAPTLTVTVAGVAHTAQLQSVAGLPTVRPAQEKGDLGAQGKPQAGGRAAPVPTAPRPGSFTVVLLGSDPVASLLEDRYKCQAVGDRSRCVFDATVTTLQGTFVARGGTITALQPSMGTPATLKVTIATSSLTIP